MHVYNEYEMIPDLNYDMMYVDELLSVSYKLSLYLIMVLMTPNDMSCSETKWYEMILIYDNGTMLWNLVLHSMSFNIILGYIA